MPRRTRVWWALSALLLSAVVLVAVGLWQRTQRGDRKAAAAVSRSGAGAESASDAVARESRALLESSLPGVYLGMPLKSLLAHRRALRRYPQGDEGHHLVFEESLSDGGRALCSVHAQTRLLDKVQIASRLDSIAQVEPRLKDLQQRLGPATGVYDCPQRAGQLPMRRFAWLRRAAGATDNYLLLGEQIMVTQYVARTAVLLESLRDGACVAVSPEALSRFPAMPAPRTAHKAAP